MTKHNKAIWFAVRSADGAEFVATLPGRQDDNTGAFAAHGVWVDYPFTVERPATREEITWAEAEVEQRIESAEAELEAHEQEEVARFFSSVGWH